MNEEELKRIDLITENLRLNCTESAFEPLNTDGKYNNFLKLLFLWRNQLILIIVYRIFNLLIEKFLFCHILKAILNYSS